MLLETKILSQDPFIKFCRLAPTLAHVWFDPNAIDLTDEDVADIKAEAEWQTGNRVIVRVDDAFHGVFELLLAPSTLEHEIQFVMEQMTHHLRQAAPGSSDYEPNPQKRGSELKLAAQTDDG